MLGSGMGNRSLPPHVASYVTQGLLEVDQSLVTLSSTIFIRGDVGARERRTGCPRSDGALLFFQVRLHNTYLSRDSFSTWFSNCITRGARGASEAQETRGAHRARGEDKPWGG